MEILIEELDKYKEKLQNKYNLLEKDINELYSVYPFNNSEYVISHLLYEGVLTLEQYLDIRQNYIGRNKYLHLFELAPRSFGETWGQKYLMEHIPELEIPTKQKDPLYLGQYDLWYKNIKIEVKASRVVQKKPGGTLTSKALRYSDKNKKDIKYEMNFQQLKPSCCDVYVWIAVWKDYISYWVMSSSEVRNHRSFSSQHRRENVEKDNVFEGQIMMKNSNIDEFDKYQVNSQEILDTIVLKSKLN